MHHSSSSSPEKKSFGKLEVKVIETRDISINWIIGRVELTSRLSELKKNHSSAHQFTDIFHYNVGSADAELVIEAWRKNIIVKDTLRGVLKIPISSLLDEQIHTGWYPLSRPVKSTKDAAADEHDDDDEGKEEEKGKNKKKKNSEIRLEIKFEKNTPPKEVLTGIILQDQWTKENTGGTLLNNSRWSQNPQFLLGLDEAADVTIKLRQPEASQVRASFCVVHYDEFYSERRKVILDQNEIVKIDNFVAPLVAVSVTSTMHISKGRYVVIPFTESVPATGDFTLAVSAKNMDDLSFYKIPKSAAEDWDVLRLAGEWNAHTAGGGDILGLNWRKNPQYQLKIHAAKSDVCIVIEQDDITRCVGLYVVKQIDIGKKVVDYSDEVGKTDNFKFICSSGLKIPRLAAGSYVIIPATYESEVFGPFRLAAYVNDPNASLGLITSEWNITKEVRGAWAEGLAGGSPNNTATFTKNPHYALTFRPSQNPFNILIQLVQESAHYEEASIGFIVVKTPKVAKKIVGADLTNDDIYCKPEGWVPKVDVVCRATVEPDHCRTFVIIPSTFRPDIFRSFQLNVYSDEDFSLELL